VNSVASPRRQSRISRSYASGLDSVNDSPYAKSMVTSRSSIEVPGTLEPNRTVMPSSGWMRTTKAFCPSSSTAVWANGRCGARWKITAISVTRRPSRLPVRR
jgi:hypothetical protein